MNSKWSRYLNVRPESKNLLGEILGSKLPRYQSWKLLFWDLTPKANAAKEKNMKVGLLQTKKPHKSQTSASNRNSQQNAKSTY